MIKAVRKPLEEIRKMLSGYKKVLIAGCNTCVAVCFAGGEKEVEILASALLLSDKKEKIKRSYLKKTVQRQCEDEFVEELDELVKKSDVVLSTACGIGVQTIADNYPDAVVLPALNTTFLGRAISPGYFFEYCEACGNCVLDKTGGICPVARCAKSLLNGPCGGSQDGKCEVSKDIPCVWELIYEKLSRLKKIDLWEEVKEPKDWSKGPSGVTQTIVRKDLFVEEK